MKEESVLNVLMYLFQNHMGNNAEVDGMDEELMEQLEEAGFNRPLIKQAFDWLENLAYENHILIKSPSKNSFRVYSPYESELIDTECQGFLMNLEGQDILNPITREAVITRLLELDSEGIQLSLVKWVTLMVLFNQPDEEHALACMEFLVLEEAMGENH